VTVADTEAGVSYVANVDDVGRTATPADMA
jgi:hypothetical protein